MLLTILCSADGTEEEPKQQKQRRLIDVIVETVYECSMNEESDVHLQVIKAMLTSVTSVNCPVHDHSLLLAIRSCFHIFLMSRNPTLQTTAKATLTQMLNIVLQRMEHFGEQARQLDKTSSEA